MRQDWDYVLMGDYQHDMDELREQGAGIIARQRNELDRVKSVLAAVLAKVGPVKLTWGEIDRMDEHQLVEERFEYDMSRVYSSRSPKANGKPQPRLT